MPTPGGIEVVIAVAFLFVVAAAAFFVAAKRRAAIDAAMKGSRNVERLGLLDLSRHDAMTKLEQKYLAIPERLWTYDGFYLEKFATAAAAAPLPPSNVLQAYIGPTMSADIVFAAALGLFAALFDFGVATALLPKCPLTGDVMLFCAGMGLVYGCADVAEDLKLTSILKDWHSASGAGQHIHIDGGEAAAANALTRIKMVTLTLSIAGIAAFGALAGIAYVIFPPPADTTPSSRPQNPVPVGR